MGQEISRYEIVITVTFQPVNRYGERMDNASYIELRRKISANDLAETITAVDTIGKQ